jgi:WD40 repeat protein
LSVCFSPKAENKNIITLCGQPDWMLLFWDWDKEKVMAKINIGITGIPASISQKQVLPGQPEPEFNYSVSFNPFECEYIVVTGPDTYKYYKIDGAEFDPIHTLLNNKDRDITTRYSCHAWMHDGPLIVCTEVGEIIMCETDGSYKAFIPHSPTGDDFKIEAIVSFSRGFIVAGNSLIYAYEKSDDPRVPYRLITDGIEVKMDTKDSMSSPFGANMNYHITSMTLS